jgi:predicted nucleotidyltransferase
MEIKGTFFMDKIPDTIKPIIEKFLNSLYSSGIEIDSAFLFGSYSKGNSNEWSDIDIALVSGSFTGNRIKDRDKFRKLARSVSSMIELMPFSRNDFNEGNPFAKEIIKTGIRIM